MQPNKFFAVQRLGHFQTTGIYRTLAEAAKAADKLRKSKPSGRWFVFSCQPIGSDSFIDDLLACENVEVRS